MARPDKVATVTEVRERMEGSTATMLTEYRGLTVGQLARLRAELRKAGAEYRVVKNTLTKIAVKDAGYEVPDELLTGPTAVTFCGDDPVAAAKALRTFAKDNPALVVKGGILEGRFIDAGEATRLADLASREELLAQLAGLMQAVVAQPARLALASLSKAARLFAALQDKRAAAGETMDAPAAAADDAPAAAAEEAPAEQPAAAEEPAASGVSSDEGVPTVEETPEPDSPEAQAITDAAADAGVNATPGDTGPEGKAEFTAPELAANEDPDAADAAAAEDAGPALDAPQTEDAGEATETETTE
jgi:large subunit ribosomal protein L10